MSGFSYDGGNKSSVGGWGAATGSFTFSGSPNKENRQQSKSGSHSGDSGWGWTGGSTGTSRSSGSSGSSGGGNKSSSSFSSGWPSGGNKSSGSSGSSGGGGWGGGGSSGGGGGWGSAAPKPAFNFPQQPGGAATGQGEDNPAAEYNALRAQYEPSHQECRFECVLYSRLPPNANKSQFHKPPLMRPQVWENGVRENPDPEGQIPVGVRGVEGLQERAQLCLAGWLSIMKHFQGLQEQLGKARAAEERMQQDLVQLRRSQEQLSYRLLHVLRQHVQLECAEDAAKLAVSTFRGSPGPGLDGSGMGAALGLTTDEVRLKNALHGMQMELRRLFQEFSRVDDMFEPMEMEGRRQRPAEVRYGMGGGQRVAAPPKEKMGQLFKFLHGQQQIIQHMTRTVTTDLEDLNIMMKGLSTGGSY